MAGAASSPNVDILIAGTEVSDSHFLSYAVNRDMFQPDHAVVELSNDNSEHSSHKIGDPFEIKVGEKKTSIFKGEITAVKAIFKGGGQTTVQIHALNKLARLARIRKSVTFTDKTDEQILKQVIGDAGLSLKWKHQTSITYKHVYQHNQTDLEFLRTRAARLGCHLWCVDTTLYVQEPDFGTKSGIKLKADKAEEGTIRLFSVMTDVGTVVKKVRVRGWNPETKEKIEGDASAASSQLGSQNAPAAAGALAGEETYIVDHPIASKQEADALAKARLQDLNLKFMTGEIEIDGNADVELGKSVEVTVNSTKGDDPFNGNYYVMGVRHVHRVEKNKSAKAGEGGFVTTLRVARDGQKA